MRNFSINPSRVLILSFFLLFFSQANAQAQAVSPDEQIVREMIAFVNKTEDALLLSRPRLAGKENPAEDVAFKKTEFIPVESGSINDLELKAFEIINQQRAAKGLRRLEWSEDLARVARLHSNNMALEKFFSHTGSDGSMVNHRADRLGISQWLSIGENIAFNRGFKKPVEMACQHWMNSPSHRENILNKKWKESGIGVAVAPDGAYFFTQVFILK